MSYAHFHAMGNLTRDPELSFTPTNTPVCKFGIAVNEKVKGEEKAHYFNCVAWAKTAEAINQYFHKGKPIVVMGRLKQDRWEDKDGNKRQSVDLSVFEFHFVPRDKTDTSGGGGPDRSVDETYDQQHQPTSKTQAAPRTKIEEDDIPF